MRPGTTQGQAWTVSGSPAHAYKGSKDLGLLVGTSQVVQPTNNGRLWSLGDLQPDGSVNWKGAYGSVPGAPPPPNAHLNEAAPQQYQQAARRQRPMYAPAPQYAPPPPPYMQAPQYAPPPYAVAPMFQDPAMFATPVYQDPTQFGMPQQDPMAYAQQGAALALAGAQQASQADLLTLSVLSGGGAPGGDFSGMSGGFDAETLAYLSGGDSDAATQMMLQNGGYGSPDDMIESDG